MLESYFKKIAYLKVCNFLKKGAEHRCFPVNIAKFLRTIILKNIFERMLLTVRKYAINDILQLLYDQPSTDIHKASTKFENSSQILEKSIRNEVVGVGLFEIGPPKGKALWIQCSPLLRLLVAPFSQNLLQGIFRFLHKFRGQYGTEDNLNRMFQKIAIFLKSGKNNQTWGIWNFLENSWINFSHFLPECRA